MADSDFIQDALKLGYEALDRIHLADPYHRSDTARATHFEVVGNATQSEAARQVSLNTRQYLVKAQKNRRRLASFHMVDAHGLEAASAMVGMAFLMPEEKTIHRTL